MRYLLVLLFLSGCGGESAQSVADAHRPAASAKLAKITALAPVVAKQPPLTQDAWNLPAGVQLDFVPHGDALNEAGNPLPSPTYNAAIAFDQHLAKPSGGAWVEWQSGNKDTFLLLIDKSDSWLIEPACLLETGKGRGGGEVVVDVVKVGLSWLERTQYVLVLRLETRRPPGLVLDELRRGEMSTFSGGQVAGDALLYDIETGAFLGGFVVDVKSRSEEEVRNADVHGQLQRKLAEDVDTFIKDKLARVGRPPR